MTTAPELAIRLARATFNRAIADGNLAMIEPILAPDVILVAGTDSALISGRKAQTLTWKREFASADRAIYARTPETIIVSTVEPIAFEHGAWLGVARDGRARASGTYMAKWHLFGAAWRI